MNALKAIAKRYGLNRRTGPVARELDFSELAHMRELVMGLWKQCEPNTPHESDFMQMFGCHPNTFCEGEVSISKNGAGFTLHGTAPDEQWVLFMLNIPRVGPMSMSSDVYPPLDQNDI